MKDTLLLISETVGDIEVAILKGVLREASEYIGELEGEVQRLQAMFASVQCVLYEGVEPVRG
jgi:hypothetical protein